MIGKNIRHNNIRHLANYVILYKQNLFIVFLSLISVSCALLSIGFIFRNFIDNGLSTGNINEVHNYLYAIIVLIGVFSIGSFCRSYFINVIAVKVISKLQSDTYAKLLKIDLVRFEDLKIGDIISRLVADIEIIGNLIINTLSFLIRNSIMLIGAIILMFIQSPKLSLLVLITIPIFLIPLIKLSKHVRSLSRIVLAEQGTLAATIEENFSGIRTIYAYNQQEFAASNFAYKIDNYIKHAAIRLRFRSLFFAIAIAVISSTITMVIWIGSVDIIKGDMSSGQMLSFIYYALIVGMSSGGVAELFSEMQGPLAALDRVIELKNISQENTIAYTKFLTNIGDDYTIKFNEVSFAYPSRPDILALNNISLTIDPGKFTAIVGKSGSGKSTLMQLLLKFYTHKIGQITIGKNDINTLDEKIIRARIAYVEQYPTIFSGTIRSNIAFSNPNASDNEIKQIAKICGISEFVKTYDLGLDTEIGEKGIRISGGQRQRIAIARALLYKPEILLLDEATSALDNDSEKKLLHNIRDLMKNRTIISIAHRISSIENADEILVIDQGCFESKGSHIELLGNSKIYNILYKEQKNYSKSS